MEADDSVIKLKVFSRIKAYVDIMEINPRFEGAPILYMKRAVLLRSLILRRMGVLDEIDSDLSLHVDEKVLLI